MSITSIARKLFDGNTKKLIKAKFLNSDLSITERGRAALDAIAVQENMDALVELASERIEEDKEDCCKK